MSWTDRYRPGLDLNPDTTPILVASVVDEDHWSVKCPSCGRINTHGAEVGYRHAHCQCGITSDGGYVLAPPGALWAPYVDHCRACGVGAGYYTPRDMEPSEHRKGVEASYVCDRSHTWGCYWGDPPYGPRVNVSPDGGRRCALYRHFDAAGVLLYVGISDAPVVRGKSHAKYSNWVRFAVRMEAEWLDSREAAERAERAAIRTERPIFNVAHAVGESVERMRRYVESQSAGVRW